MKIMKNVKRILALFLCICMVAACWTAEPVQAASTLYTSDDEENKSYTLNGEKHTICYEDDFATEADYINALGSYAGHPNQIPWGKGAISPDGTSGDNALFYGIKDAENMQNYTISADVKIKSGSKFTALVAHGASTSTTGNGIKGYEFGIVGSNVDMDGDGTKEMTPCFRIYPRGGDTTNMTIGGTAEYAVETWLEGYTTGTTVNMRFEIKTESDGVVMNCYAALDGGDEVVIFTNVKDTTTKKLESGVPGFRTSDTSGGLISNVCVTSIEDDASYMYKDDFSYTEGYTAALGETTGMKISNGALLCTSSTATSQFQGITNADARMNYTISADFTYSSLSAGTYNGLSIYGNSGAGKGYELALTSGAFRLFRRGTSQGAIHTSGKVTGTTGIFPGLKINTTQEATPEEIIIRLSLTAITTNDNQVYLIAKAMHAGEEVTIYSDYDSTNAYKEGYSAIKGNQANSTADNVVVQTNDQYLASLSETYADTLALGTGFAPYDIPKVDKMLAAYEGLDILLDAETVTALEEISSFRENWDTTSDETIAASYQAIYEADKWDTETAWNVYQRLSADQKALLTDVYGALVEDMQAEEQTSDNAISIGWVGDAIPTGLVDGLVGDAYTYSVETFTGSANYDMIVLAQALSEDELHSYMQTENTPLVVVTTDLTSVGDAEVNLQLAEKYALPWIDINAYTNGGGTDVAAIYADAILSMEPLFATETTMGFSYDVNELNTFLSPELFSATIKNEPLPENQGLGFKTNISEYQKTGTKIKSYGTIFAHYDLNEDYSDMILANVTEDSTKYIKAERNIIDDSDVHGTSYIAGINRRTNDQFSVIYIARSYVEYEDGSVYYSMNTREDLASDLATRIGVKDGYASRALTGVAKNMVIALAERNIDISSVGNYDATTKKLTFNSEATADNAKLIFELLCNNQGTLDTIQNAVYLASGGNDENIGSQSAPVATLEKALELVNDEGVIWVEDTVEVASDFTWTERDREITITGGGTLDFSETDDEGNTVWRTLILGDDVTFDNVGLTFSTSTGQANTTSDVIYANGHTLVVEEDVTMTGRINLYGGGKSNSEPIESTNVTLKSGQYRRIFGGSEKGTVGNVDLYIGGNVNENAGLDLTDHSHSNSCDVYGGGDGDVAQNAVTGTIRLTMADNAIANYVLGGCRNKKGSVNTTYVEIKDNVKIFSLFGGNDNSPNVNGTHIKMTGGEVEQLFGAIQSSNNAIGEIAMSEGVTIDLLGGKITRRIYGGCYNDYGTSDSSPILPEWKTRNYVNGTIRLNISSAINISLDAVDPDSLLSSKYNDRSIFACSRYEEAFDDEYCIITFLDSQAVTNYKDKLGHNATFSTMNDVSAYDEIVEPQ